MTVYIDIVLIENLCMNYIILFATGIIIKTKMKHIKVILSALLGSIYAILVYIQILPIYSNFTVKIILSICMVYIAFTPKSWRLLLKELVIFYLISFSFGGCAFALLYIVKPQNIFLKDGVYIGTYPIKMAILGGIVGFAIVYISFKIVKSKISKRGLIYEININIDGKIKTIKAMLDTGNQLKDPITEIPVMLVEKEELRKILPDRILDNIEEIKKGNWEGCEQEKEYRARFRIIPFQSVGKQNGMLLGFKADEIKVMNEMEDILIKNIIIGIYNGKFTKTNAYSALVGLDIVERSELSEYFTNVKI